MDTKNVHPHNRRIPLVQQTKIPPQTHMIDRTKLCGILALFILFHQKTYGHKDVLASLRLCTQ